MGLREEKKARLKRDIYRTAVKLFLEKGFEETRVEDITRRLRISRGTFFNYYPNKGSILHKIAEETVRLHRKMLEEKIAARASTREKIERLLEGMGKGIEVDKRFYRAVFLEIMRGQMGLVGERGSMEKSTISDLTVSIITQGQARGELRSDYEAQQLAEILVGTYNNVILNWLHTDTDYSLTDRLREAADFFLLGSSAARSTAPRAPRARPAKRS